LFNDECLQKFSSNGQIWLPKKPYITRFNWASKTKNSFETGFQQPKIGLQKIPILTSLLQAKF